MAMAKVVEPAGWDFGRNIVQLVKMSSRGLIGHDRDEFIKTAGHELLPAIDNIKLGRGDVPIQMIALGGTEMWGPNRNADGFKLAACRRYHDTFVKHAKFFRNHRNKLANNDPYYGYVKASAINEPMQRVELLAILNGTKEAADRNGGFVADKELDKLNKGIDLPVSMACSVPYDVCSGCENKAKTRDEYCDEKTCKRGGCKDNLGKVLEDGHVLHVDNEKPLFFDISHVYRPADRTAYATKAASGFISGAELAEQLGVTAPLSVLMAMTVADQWNPAMAGKVKLAQMLALVEAEPLGVPDNVFREPRLNDVELAALGRPGTEKAAAALGALADQRVVLGLENFARWLGKEAAVDDAAALLPGIYQQLTSTTNLETLLACNRFDCFEKIASENQRKLAATLAGFHALTLKSTTLRAARNSLCDDVKRPAVIKSAADSPQGHQLAETYALYKLAALQRIASFDSDFVLTVRLAIGQNRA